jgi:hypothetical protein
VLCGVHRKASCEARKRQRRDRHRGTGDAARCFEELKEGPVRWALQSVALNSGGTGSVSSRACLRSSKLEGPKPQRPSPAHPATMRMIVTQGTPGQSEPVAGFGRCLPPPRRRRLRATLAPKLFAPADHQEDDPSSGPDRSLLSPTIRRSGNSSRPPRAPYAVPTSMILREPPAVKLGHPPLRRTRAAMRSRPPMPRTSNPAIVPAASEERLPHA